MRACVDNILVALLTRLFPQFYQVLPEPFAPCGRHRLRPVLISFDLTILPPGISARLRGGYFP